MSNFRISDVRFRPGTPVDEQAGLLGWASFIVNESLKVASVAVRRTRANVITLAFPTRRDRQGIEHGIVTPVDQPSHRAIESTVLAALRRQGALK